MGLDFYMQIFPRASSHILLQEAPGHLKVFWTFLEKSLMKLSSSLTDVSGCSGLDSRAESKPFYPLGSDQFNHGVDPLFGWGGQVFFSYMSPSIASSAYPHNNPGR